MLAGCGGDLATVPEHDASAPDDSATDDASLADDVPSFSDALVERAPVPDPGARDGGDVWCGVGQDGGARYCRTPEDFCCIGWSNDAGITHDCLPFSAQHDCAFYAYCDDSTDCAQSLICCAGGTTLAPLGSSHCEAPSWCACMAPNCWSSQMCDPAADGGECAAWAGGHCQHLDAGSGVLQGYSTCHH
jgi:hypothetical protein